MFVAFLHLNQFRSVSCLLGFVLLLSACTSTKDASQTDNADLQERPANASNYERDLVYPRETEYFVSEGNLVVYEDPFYGAAIAYVDKRDYPDIITVFFYPIPTTSWNNLDVALNGEVEEFLTELDNTVKVGVYQRRGQEVLSDFMINKNGQTYRGKKVHFDFANQQGTEFNADAYIFIQKDKFVKIRTSSPKDFTPDWNGDLIAEELIPEFDVPDESEYMRKLRDEYRRQPPTN